MSVHLPITRHYRLIRVICGKENVLTCFDKFGKGECKLEISQLESVNVS